jgi:uncharacterized protein YciW
MNKDNELMLEALHDYHGYQNRPGNADRIISGMNSNFITSELHKVHTKLNQLSTMIHLNRSAETDQLLSKIRDASEMLMTDAPAEDAENEPHGYPQGMTAIQNTLINELKKRGFQLTKISHEDKERDKYPTVFMSRKSNFMHSVVEISGMGEINGEHYKAYLAGSNNSEDAESARPTNVSNDIKTKLGQAYDIVKGLIDMLDKTPAEQTPYNEMAITHLVNLEEDLKELSWMLKDRMLKK